MKAAPLKSKKIWKRAALSLHFEVWGLRSDFSSESQPGLRPCSGLIEVSYMTSAVERRRQGNNVVMHTHAITTHTHTHLRKPAHTRTPYTRWRLRREAQDRSPILSFLTTHTHPPNYRSRGDLFPQHTLHTPSRSR